MDEAAAFGCKCSHILRHPEYCVVLDEVGGNINMKGDGHIGGEMYLCEPGVILEQKSSRADKHFTLLGLTLLSGGTINVYCYVCGDEEKYSIRIGSRSKSETCWKYGE